MQSRSCLSPLSPSGLWTEFLPISWPLHMLHLCNSPHGFCFRPCTLPGNLLLILHVSVKRSLLQWVFFSHYTSQARISLPIIYSYDTMTHIFLALDPSGGSRFFYCLPEKALLILYLFPCYSFCKLPLKQVLIDTFSNSPE